MYLGVSLYDFEFHSGDDFPLECNLIRWVVGENNLPQTHLRLNYCDIELKAFGHDYPHDFIYRYHGRIKNFWRITFVYIVSLLLHYIIYNTLTMLLAQWHS